MKQLTARQEQVMRLFAEGLTGDLISVRLGLEQTDVSEHKRRIEAKFGSLEAAATHYMADEDELPDPDEPSGPVRRCKCGLVLPCHRCLSLDYVQECWNLAVRDPDGEEIHMVGERDRQRRLRAGKRKADAVAKP